MQVANDFYTMANPYPGELAFLLSSCRPYLLCSWYSRCPGKARSAVHRWMKMQCVPADKVVAVISQQSQIVDASGRQVPLSEVCCSPQQCSAMRKDVQINTMQT